MRQIVYVDPQHGDGEGEGESESEWQHERASTVKSPGTFGGGAAGHSRCLVLLELEALFLPDLEK